MFAVVDPPYSIAQFFSGKLAEFLRAVAKFSESESIPIALVGGPVRDCLLRRAALDVDFVVGVAAERFLRAFLVSWASSLPGILQPKLSSVFERYGTAKLEFAHPPEGLPGMLDFASARTEVYPRPGRAPEVEYPVALDVDLGRRDFTINSMAFVFGSEGSLELLDPLNGRADLEAGVVRVLHSLSFLEDPARLIRGLRFLNRFSFRFDETTEELFHQAMFHRALHALTPQRRFDEFRKAFREADVLSLLESFDRLNMFAELHPRVNLSERVMKAASATESREERIVGSLLEKVADKEYEALLKGWGLSRKQAAEWAEVRKNVV